MTEIENLSMLFMVKLLQGDEWGTITTTGYREEVLNVLLAQLLDEQVITLSKPKAVILDDSRLNDI